MGQQQGIEIRYSSDGPYLTFHGGGSRVTYRLRDVARGLSQTAEAGLQRRILNAWLKDREAERKED
jgi:lipoate-protein ligase B